MQFPEVIEGLGNLREEHEIKLKPNAKLYSLYTPRHVPLSLRTKVTELDGVNGHHFQSFQS